MTWKILLVDDERSIRDSLGKVLRKEGCEVRLAEDGQQAAGWLAEQQPQP